MKFIVILFCTIIFSSYATAFEDGNSALALSQQAPDEKDNATHFNPSKFHYNDAIQRLGHLISNAKFYLGEDTGPSTEDLANKGGHCFDSLSPLTEDLGQAHLAIVNLVGGIPELGLMPELQQDSEFIELSFSFAFGLKNIRNFCNDTQAILGSGEQREFRFVNLDDVESMIEGIRDQAVEMLGIIEKTRSTAH